MAPRYLAPCSGSALVIVLLALLLISALGAAMVILATADTLAATNQRDARIALYAAESAVELAADEVVRVPDWGAVLSGAVRSSRVDGSPSGPRRMPDGRVTLLEELPNLANCGMPATCTEASLTAVTGDRPWGANNPRWRLFAYGAAGGAPPSLPVYTVVLVADDPMESDGRPDLDAPSGAPGSGVLMFRAEAFGPAGSHRIIQAVVERAVAGGGAVAPRFLSWWTVG
jgi:type II secretory pathway pseudopilin PulG